MNYFLKISLFSGLASLISLTSFAETLRCKSPDSSGFSLVAETTHPPTVSASLTAKLKLGRFRRSKTLTLKRAPRKATLNYVDHWNPQDLWLSLGTFQGAGRYSNATLTLSKGTPEEKVLALKCDLAQPESFINYCEVTPQNNPEKNLFRSARTGNADLFFATLACGLDVNTLDDQGCTPLLALSDKNCGTGQFSPYASTDIKEMVASVLQAGAFFDIDAEDPLTGETALLKVVRIQDLDSAKELIGSGADVNYQDKLGFSALMRAVETGYLKMAEALIGAGADISLTNADGLTALDIAKANGFRNFLPILSLANIVTIEGDASGTCSSMSFDLKLGVPNQVVLKTKNPMLMLEARDLGINLMASPGTEASTIVTPKTAGSFAMTCGPRMGGGNPSGSINVR